jgi:hypothetical protein
LIQDPGRDSFVHNTLDSGSKVGITAYYLPLFFPT